jgi:hypothetical protein
MLAGFRHLTSVLCPFEAEKIKPSRLGDSAVDPVFDTSPNGAIESVCAPHLIRPSATWTRSFPTYSALAGFRLCRTPFAIFQCAQLSPVEAEKVLARAERISFQNFIHSKPGN